VCLAAARVEAQIVACAAGAETQPIEAALARIEASVDPCGDSSEIRAMLATLRGCTTATYQICSSPVVSRNLFDRLPAESGTRPTRIITWNPDLESDLEAGCDGDPSKPVRRDPTASLLHELVHAAHDCLGIDPGQLEFEAVRIENIYRRAAGLCQRSHYGDDPLPAELRKTCDAVHCTCSAPDGSGEVAHLADKEDASAEPRGRLGDSAESR
jgi:hypothetical protein